MINKKLICVVLLSVLCFCDELKAQEYYNYAWEGTDLSKARFAIYPPEESSSSKYIVKLMEDGKETETSGIFDCEKKGLIGTGILILFNSKRDTLEMTTYLKGNKEGPARVWWKDGSLYGRLSYKNNLENGLCEWFFPSGQISASYICSEGKRHDEHYWNEDGSEASPKYAEVEPKFKKGDLTDFTRYIHERLVYPEYCKEMGIQGRVVLSFVVNTNGMVSDVRVIKSVQYELDKEALRVVSGSPLWTPGRRNNQVVNVRFVFPIIFQLRQGRASYNTYNSRSRLGETPVRGNNLRFRNIR